MKSNRHFIVHKIII
ncbi:hypothetical protein F383_14986 [Gossypium arboreum]|uniref:Uncharacterized protein n=1 Tax=Gossypium arboreum TaxID=29729 RepID=A0A0B0PT36_GOSAR|nr:hypothetical protein F383_14986 [Gossypium arboreum]